MLTGLLIIFPLVAAVMVLFMRGKTARTAALFFSAIELALSDRKSVV